MDPAIIDALRRCGAVSVSDKVADEDDHLRWIDGYNQHSKAHPTYQKPLAEICGSGFQGCRRDQLLEELAKHIPSGTIMFHKRLDTIQQGKDHKMILNFVDGSSNQADAGTTVEMPICSSRRMSS